MSAESEADFNNTLDYVQECLPLQSSINQSLDKDDLRIDLFVHVRTISPVEQLQMAPPHLATR